MTIQTRKHTKTVLAHYICIIHEKGLSQMICRLVVLQSVRIISALCSHSNEPLYISTRRSRPFSCLFYKQLAKKSSRVSEK